VTNASKYSCWLTLLLSCSCLLLSACSSPRTSRAANIAIPPLPASSQVSPLAASPGQTRLVYKDHAGPVGSVQWSPDGNYLASAGIGSDMKLWDAWTGHTLHTFTTFHENGVGSIAWSHDGKRIAVGTWQALGPGYAEIFDASTYKTLLTYQGHQTCSSVDGVAWSPDDQYVVSSGCDGTVQVWKSKTGKLLKTFHFRYQVLDVGPVAWSPDGTSIAATSTNTTTDSEVQLWNFATGQTQSIYRGHKGLVDSLIWSANSKLLLSSGSDHTVQVWEATTSKNLITYREHTGRVYSADFSPDGKRIVSASEDKTVREFDTATGNTLLIYKDHTGPVYAAVWSPDGTEVASASGDGTVRVWKTT
jgi:WD40 repeat protein